MTTSIDQGIPKKPKRPRFRFSLRSLLLVTTALCLWLGWQAHRAREQREAVDALRSLGFQFGKPASIYYDRAASESWAPNWLRAAIGDDFFVNVTHVYLHDVVTSEYLPEAIAQLRRLPSLRALTLDNPQISNKDLAQLVVLGQVHWLCLNFNRDSVTAEGLQSLADMRNVQELTLGGGWLNNDVISVMPKFANVETLALFGEAVNDDGLIRLAECRRLKTLSLHCGSLTAPGLKALADIKSLKELTFHNMLFGVDLSANISPSPDAPADTAWQLSPFSGFEFQDFTSDSPGGFQRLSDWFHQLRPDAKLGWSQISN